MRQTKDVEIDKRVYTVRELTVKEIIGVFERHDESVKSKDKDEETTDAGDTDTTGSIGFLKSELQEMLNLALEKGKEGEEYTMDDFIDFAPSDLKLLYDTFREVNQVFFDIARQLGAGKIVEDMIAQIRMSFSGVLATSLSRGMSESLITDTPTT